MEQFGVTLVDVEPFPQHPYCNKIRQCATISLTSFDQVILLDCDVFILDDPASLPADADIAAKIVDFPNPPLGTLLNIFAEAGLASPETALSMMADHAGNLLTLSTNWNGGFYVVRGDKLRVIGHEWARWADWLLARISLLGEFRVHVDQVAMAMAIISADARYALLGPECNFPIHVPNHLGRFASGDEPIRVLHYHDRTDAHGFVLPVGIAKLDRLIAKANHQIQGFLDQNFDNPIFWNLRYTLHPALGSGIGSREETLKMKREILRTLTAPYLERPILDVGCGDIETVRHLPFTNYTGTDSSAAALALAAEKRPEWKFVPTETAFTDQYALILCLDVLIHQKRRVDYDRLIETVANITTERLIISGYDAPPSHASSITAYHEPLGASLAKTGQFDAIVPIGTYREVTLYAATRPPSSPRHNNDLDGSTLATLLPFVDDRLTLQRLIDLSREKLGFFTKTVIRCIEYPWVADCLRALDPGTTVMDIGAGVSPLPLLLAERGLQIHCFDNHSLTRRPETRAEWNEWGFLDYSSLHQHVSSFRCTIEDIQPAGTYDGVYSVSVLEHMPRMMWESTLRTASSHLADGGPFVLTLDLVPGTRRLWNLSEGKTVEDPDAHGTVDDVLATLRECGISVTEHQIVSNVPGSRTDLALINGRKSRSGRPSTDTPMNAASPVIVLGMHRSGTSAITGCLASLGLDAGEHLQEGNQYNPKGYFEDKRVVKAHDTLLSALGTRWDDLRPLPEGWLEAPPTSECMQAIADIMEEAFARQQPWIVKDPRMCRLLPMWLQLFEQRQVSPRFVIAIRDPMSSAQSLSRRDGMDSDAAYILWTLHLLDAERHTRRHRRCFISYERFLADWRNEIRQIDQSLALNLQWSMERESAADHLIDHSLNHRESSGTVISKAGSLAHDCHFALTEAGDPAARLEQLRPRAETLRYATLSRHQHDASGLRHPSSRGIAKPHAEGLQAVAAPPHPRYEADLAVWQSALAMIESGDLADGADQLILLAQADTPVWEVYHDLAAIAIQQNDDETALLLLEQAVAKAPHPGKACWTLASRLAAIGENEKALEVLSPLLRSDPSSFDTLDLTRQLLGKLGPLSPIAWARLLTDLRITDMPDRS